MSFVRNARRVVAFVNYQGKDITAALASDLIDLTYNDAAPGEADDLQIKLSDRELKWMNKWKPAKGDVIKCQLKVFDWDRTGDNRILNCGIFEVDDIQVTGPPNEVSIKALSVPLASGAKNEARTVAWESFTLQSIASQVAKRAGLTLSYNASENPKYDRQDQTDTTDLAFLNELAKKEGIALKVSNGKLVLFDEYQFEKATPAFTLEVGVSDIKSYSFSDSVNDVAYVACEITYQQAVKKEATTAKKKKDAKTTTPTTPKTAVASTTTDTKKKGPKKDRKQKKKKEQPKMIKAVYRAPGAPANGPILKINGSTMNSPSEALRAAKNALREKNKEANKGSMTLMGDIRAFSGVTFNVKGLGKFDAKYIIESAAHNHGSSGYTTTINIRKVLGW